MTVTTESVSAGPYVGNGTSATFSFGFRVDDAAELLVYKYLTSTGASTQLVEGTDFSISGLGSDSGGTITLTAGALPSGYTLRMRSNYPRTQTANFPSQGGFFPQTHMQAMDRLARQIQQLQYDFNRLASVPADPAEMAAVAADSVVVDYLETMGSRVIPGDVFGTASNADVLAGTAGKVPDAEQVRDRYAITVSSVAEAAALTGMSAGQSVNLVAGGRSGIFDVVAGDFTAKVTADTLNGIYIAMADDPTGATKCLVRRLNWFVTPEMFGAIGNGVTDDTIALNTALGFGRLVLGMKTYLVSGLLVTADKTEIIGFGYRSALKLANGSNTDLITTSVAGRNFGTTIRGVTLECNGSNQTSGSGINLYKTLGWRITDCHIKDANGDGIKIGGDTSYLSLDTYIHHNRIENSGGMGIRIGTYSATVEASNNIIGASGVYGIDVSNVDTRITTNHIFAAGQYGIAVRLTSANCQITGNHIESCRRDGISLQGASSVTVTGNVCTKNSRVTSPGVYDGIALISRSGIECHDITIMGNRSWSEGIIDGGGLVQRYGISIEGGSYNLTVVGNSLDGNRNGAILDGGAVNSFIENNSPYDIAATVKYFDPHQNTNLTKTVSVSCTAGNPSYKGVAGVYTLLVGVNTVANDDGLFGEFRVTLIKVSSSTFRYVIDKIAGDLTVGDLTIAFSTNTSSSCVLDVSVVDRKGINIQASQVDYAIDLFFSSALSVA